MALTEAEQSLITAATNAVRGVSRDARGQLNGDHNVGAAVLTSTGRTFTGVCLSHFTGGPCAESTAFANAAASGVDSATIPSRRDANREQLILCVAVRGTGKVINPCGRCRQQMWDYYPNIKVIVDTGDDVSEVLGLDTLLPFACVVYKDK